MLLSLYFESFLVNSILVFVPGFVEEMPTLAPSFYPVFQKHSGQYSIRNHTRPSASSCHCLDRTFDSAPHI